ncbi:hypothetical protein SAMN06272759_101636 [Novosphingobium sp. B1]|nr:hypothetical protein SAMN06272759_101636 [Novosphingobium sp. B1]
MLYDIALGIRILDLTSDKTALFAAIMLRHDCVHRNGFDKNGNELSVFTRSFVQQTADLIRALVENIERAVRQVDRAAHLQPSPIHQTNERFIERP